MLSIAIGMLCLAGAFAQEPLAEDRGAVGLAQTLRRLNTNLRVLHIAAHPDDEDASTLTWLARGQGVHLVLLALNRGEAGANLVSNDFFDRLGALRTVEFLRAVEYYGAAGLRFTRFIDYGFSKNVDETFRNWNRDEVLQDVVRVIRQERPHILISRFQGNARDGHGNHTAAGIMAQLAFEAAGDAARFPELKLEPWQPLKLYAGRRDQSEATIRIDSGQYDPLLGRTYAQVGREGYRMHRSQGSGPNVTAPGPVYGYYRLAASKVGMAEEESSFFERIPLPAPVWKAEIERARAAFRAEDPVACAEALGAALAIAREKKDFDAAIAEGQILKALEQALGIHFQALADPDEMPAGPFAAFRAWESFQHATPGQKFTVSTQFFSASPTVKTERVELLAGAGWRTGELGTGRFEVRVPDGAEPTRAYWSRGSVRQTNYRLDQEEWLGRPLPPAPLRARAYYKVGGVEAYVERDVQTSYLDQLGVQFRRSLAVAPAVSVRFPTDAGYLPVGTAAYRLTLAVRNHLHGAAKGTLRVELPKGWRSEPPAREFVLEKEGEEATHTFDVRPDGTAGEGEYSVRVVAAVNGRENSDSFLPITQPGLATVYLSRPARHSIRVVNVRVAKGLRTAYLPGTGDDVPEAMRQLGVAPDILDTSSLASGDLSKYNTILLGIRAYAARKDVKTFNGRLLDYVKNGGVLIVQYNTQEYDGNYGPAPYTMTARAEEVSEEDSPVEILDPKDSVFVFPNDVSKKDFDGWVEQRGSKFLMTWDSQWKPLIETHDTGQAPQKGAWLVARHGKGLYVYCAMAWYRQLPFAVPGAARLFANLVSLGAPNAPWR